MSIVPDERLMAYADGALPPDEARALEIMIEEDPKLAARLTPFAMTGAPLAKVFDAIAAEPIPDRLVDLIAAHAAPARSAANVRAARPRSNAKALEVFARLFGIGDAGLSAANAFALAGLVVAGGLAGWTLATTAKDDHLLASAFSISPKGDIVAVGALASALEAQASSDTAGPGGIATRSAFLAKDASGTSTYCREYRISGQGAETSGGVACREAAGTWRVATHTQLKAEAAPKGGYGTASGNVNPTIDAAIGSMIEGDILTPEQEAPLRAGGWKK